jgi:nucleotide-binding universal stress UspA family protein
MQEAADVARKFDAELTLVHVWESPTAVASALEAPRLEHVERASAELERTLASWRSEAGRASRPAHSVMLSGETGPEILRFLREGSFDLLVVGTHGRTGIRHLVLGSVAERLVREAPCRVLVVRR